MRRFKKYPRGKTGVTDIVGAHTAPVSSSEIEDIFGDDNELTMMMGWKNRVTTS